VVVDWTHGHWHYAHGTVEERGWWTGAWRGRERRAGSIDLVCVCGGGIDTRNTHTHTHTHTHKELCPTGERSSDGGW